MSSQEDGSLNGDMPAMTMPLPDGTEMLRGILADLTLALALDGYSPDPPPLADVVGGTFGDIALDGLHGTVERRASELRVELTPVPVSNPLVHAGSQRPLLNKPVHLLLANGGNVTAGLGHHTGTSTSVDMTARTRVDTVHLQLDHWRYGSEPAAWIVKLDGVRLEQGNLLIGYGAPDAPGSWAARNLRLRGNYTWHLVRTREGYSGVVEGGAALDVERVHADVTALEFTLGSRLNVGVLVGVDQDVDPCAAAAPIMARHEPTKTPLPPVPPWMERQVWMPHFFATVARALTGRDAVRFYVAINTYLDSLSDSVDSAYLALQVALEAFCRHGDPPLPALVSDERKWRAWVDSHRSEIERHATDRRAAQRLLDRLRDAARQRPSSDAVHATFASWTLAVPEDELRELGGRHRSAHRLLMNDTEEDRDLSQDLDRITIVRTLLLAAVAHEAGYGGPLYGWAGTRFGQPRWWPVTEDVAVATRWYACLRAGSEPTTQGSK